jgi:WD40 repeat protein
MAQSDGRDFQDERSKDLRYPQLHKNNSIKSIDFSKDQKILATGASNGWVKLWNFSQVQQSTKSTTHKSPSPLTSMPMYHECENANGQHLEKDQKSKEDDKCSVNNVRFLPKSNLLATTGDDGMLRVWHLNGQPFLAPIKAHKGSIKSLNLSQNGQILATAGEDGMVILWDFNGKRRKQVVCISLPRES